MKFWTRTKKINAFGLTGNIGSGKSTVAKLLAKYSDVVLFDCDSIAKIVIAEPDNRLKIIETLGENVFINSIVDYGKIAEIIFSDPVKKKVFEKLIHSVVWEYVENRVRDLVNKICIVESAIMFETGSHEMFNYMIVTNCSREERFRRLRENRNMTNEQIKVFMKNQYASFIKTQQANFIVNTECTMEVLNERVANLYEKLKKIKKL
jgi:dephospho-CoA kinase